MTDAGRSKIIQRMGPRIFDSLGIVLRYGAFGFVNLGDLSGNTLPKLVCPRNLLGEASVVSDRAPRRLRQRLTRRCMRRVEASRGSHEQRRHQRRRPGDVQDGAHAARTGFVAAPRVAQGGREERPRRLHRQLGRRRDDRPLDQVDRARGRQFHRSSTAATASPRPIRASRETTFLDGARAAGHAILPGMSFSPSAHYAEELEEQRPTPRRSDSARTRSSGRSGRRCPGRCDRLVTGVRLDVAASPGRPAVAAAGSLPAGLRRHVGAPCNGRPSRAEPRRVHRHPFRRFPVRHRHAQPRAPASHAGAVRLRCRGRRHGRCRRSAAHDAVRARTESAPRHLRSDAAAGSDLPRLHRRCGADALCLRAIAHRSRRDSRRACGHRRRGRGAGRNATWRRC